MIKLFSKYLSVGVINTALHWMVFGICYLAGINQSFSNLVAFIIAVTFSFCVNARYTFGSKVTPGRYILYVAFMGAMAAAVGSMSDNLALNPLFTLVLFSAISLVMGFFYSRFIVFRDVK
ncbi:GtrA family protein [Mixta gaviniae]|uniref:Bactoprenol-linked glucose translocase n=1 Tax=Mixta gaviniae TaxID=665914 RepID=A0A1X1DVK9_9GAMM|nr:GtrA family protein [Mixta gaviniae]AUX93879.1 translocase [Mixta gaviniae]ORM80684.1 translocase [Mixta gaviniae]